MGYIIPYHANLINEKYAVGYGILTMQGKEAKHSSIKQQLKLCSNRSKAEDKSGKWYQLMRASFIRNFYLPYHLPVFTNTYHSHYQSRIPSINGSEDEEFCICSRKLEENASLCNTCNNSLVLVESAKKGELSNIILEMLKPVKCSKCDERFPDLQSKETHVISVHENKNKKEKKSTSASKAKNAHINPARLNITQLRKRLSEMGLPTTGNRGVLERRLRGALAMDI